MSPLSKTIALWANIVMTGIVFVAFLVTRDIYYGVGAIALLLGWLAQTQQRANEALHEHLEVIEERLSEQLAKKEVPSYSAPQAHTEPFKIPFTATDITRDPIDISSNIEFLPYSPGGVDPDFPKRRDLRGDV